MGFDASTYIEKLDYDFRPYVNASGTTPEPTNDQITEFQFTVRETAQKSEIRSEMEEETIGILGLVQSLTREEVAEHWDDLNHAIAKLTSGRPSFEELTELQSKSFRHHRAYIGWLMGEIVDPEESSAVISRSRAAKNGATRTSSSAKS